MYFIHWLLGACLLVLATAAPSEKDAEVAWQSFKANHGKQYSSLQDETLRKAIFIEKFNKITAHNKLYEQGLVSYSLKINKFADMTREEMKRYKGYRKNNVAGKDIEIITFAPDKNVQVPDRFDWREKGAVTKVKDQGYCGSCWAFSATGSLEGQYFLKTGKLILLSEQNLVDCSTLNGDNGCFGGETSEAFLYIFKLGIDSESSYPYEGQGGECRFNVTGNVTSIRGYANIESGNEEHLQAAVATRGPVSIAMDASLDDFNSYAEGIYYNKECNDEYLDHAVLAVGYGTENGQDYWLMKNSWGTDWGEEGYIKIARNKDNHCGIATQSLFPLTY